MDEPRVAPTFILLTFALTWSCWALVILTPAAHRSPLLTLGGPVFLLGVFAPGLVAIALTARDGGRVALDALASRIVRWRVGWHLFAFALIVMPATKLVVAILARAITGAWPRFGDTRPAVLLAATILGTIGQAGEEIGWRGWLLPRLAERTGLAMASVVVGVVWALWHLPLFFATQADTYRQSFPLYALQVTAYSVLLAWVYWRSNGSLLLVMLMHSALNNMKDIVPSGASIPRGAFSLDTTLVFQLTVLLLWAIAAALLMRMRGVRQLNGAAAEQ